MRFADVPVVEPIYFTVINGEVQAATRPSDGWYRAHRYKNVLYLETQGISMAWSFGDVNADVRNVMGLFYEFMQKAGK
jgi:uncharacterized membrane protein